MQEEIWKDVPGYEGYYQVSNIGNVRSLDRLIKMGDGSIRNRKGMPVKHHLNKAGYSQTAFYINKRYYFQVHRMVAMAFIPNPHNKPCINHINGIRNDNRVENIEWCTHGENNRHKFGMQVSKNKNPISNEVKFISYNLLNKPVTSVCSETGLKITHASIKDCALYLNRCRGAVWAAISKKHRCAGHVVSFASDSHMAYEEGYKKGFMDAIKWVHVSELNKTMARSKTLYMSDGYQRVTGYIYNGGFVTFRGDEFIPVRVLILPDDPDNTI